MTLPIAAFTSIAVVFAVGDYVAARTRGVISSVLVAIFIFLILGGTLEVLPADIVDLAGISPLIPTFGMALILVNVGSLMNLNDLKNEWKTVVISLCGIAGIILLDLTVGTLIFGREQALAAIPPTAGGTAVTMMMTEAAGKAGRPESGFLRGCCHCPSGSRRASHRFLLPAPGGKGFHPGGGTSEGNCPHWKGNQFPHYPKAAGGPGRLLHCPLRQNRPGGTAGPALYKSDRNQQRRHLSGIRSHRRRYGLY